MGKRTEEGTRLLRPEGEEEPALGRGGGVGCSPDKLELTGSEAYFKAGFQYGRSD